MQNLVVMQLDDLLGFLVGRPYFDCSVQVSRDEQTVVQRHQTRVTRTDTMQVSDQLLLLEVPLFDGSVGAARDAFHRRVEAADAVHVVDVSGEGAFVLVVLQRPQLRRLVHRPGEEQLLRVVEAGFGDGGGEAGEVGEF